jgi:hypothetical protein
MCWRKKRGLLKYPIPHQLIIVGSEIAYQLKAFGNGIAQPLDAARVQVRTRSTIPATQVGCPMDSTGCRRDSSGLEDSSE